MYNYRFQIAAICFYLVFSIFYVRYKKLPLFVNKIFKAMHIAVGVNLLFDVITVFTLSHFDIIHPTLQRAMHQIFYLSLASFIYLFFAYVYMYTHRKTGATPIIAFHSIPYFATIITTLLCPINYHIDGYKIYSNGLAPTLIYVCVIYYLAVICVYVLKYNNMLSYDMRWGIFAGIIIEGISGLVQLFFPTLLVSGLGVSLLFAFLYMSLENPRDNVEEEIKAFNKHAFNHMIDEHMLSRRNFTIVILAIDDLTVLNFRYGQTTSNDVLKEISTYLAQTLKTNVFHPKENALAMILYCSKEDAKKQLDEIQDKINKTWVINNINTKLNFRFGVLACMRYASNLDEVYDVIEFFLLNKHSSPNGSVVEVIDDSYLTALKRYSTIEMLVSKAVSNDGFEIFYQPIYSTHKHRIVTAEALIRLKDKDTIGYISPEEFVPIAERKGLIIDLGMIVMEKVCQFAKNTNIMTMGIEYIEVNLSGLQCMEDNLWEKLKTVMDKYGMPPSFFNFEITETVITDKNDVITNNMNRLIEIGSTFSMDDFGSGNSNLSKIADLPFTLVKMDKSIVWAYFDDQNYKGKVILPHSVNMMNQLKMKIVAEGVETKEHKDALAKMGVDYLQGYYFSKPVPGEKFINIISEYNKIEA